MGSAAAGKGTPRVPPGSTIDPTEIIDALSLQIFHQNTTVIGSTEISLTTDIAFVAGAGNDELGTYSLVLDVSALSVDGGDAFVLRMKNKAATTATQRSIDLMTINTPNPPLIIVKHQDLGIDWDFTLAKTTGTDRSIPRSIYRRP